MKNTSNHPAPVAQQSRECSPAGRDRTIRGRMSLPVNICPAGQIKKRNGGPASCGTPGSSGDTFHEKKQYTDADWISTPHRGNPGCRLYRRRHQYLPAVRRDRCFVIDPIRNEHPAGSRHGPFGHATDEWTGKWHRPVRDTAGRDDERSSTLRCRALREPYRQARLRRNDEWYGTSRRLSTIRIDAIRHPTGITVERKEFTAPAGG